MHIYSSRQCVLKIIVINKTYRVYNTPKALYTPHIVYIFEFTRFYPYYVIKFILLQKKNIKIYTFLPININITVLLLQNYNIHNQTLSSLPPLNLWILFAHMIFLLTACIYIREEDIKLRRFL